MGVGSCCTPAEIPGSTGLGPDRIPPEHAAPRRGKACVAEGDTVAGYDDASRRPLGNGIGFETEELHGPCLEEMSAVLKRPGDVH